MERMKIQTLYRMRSLFKYPSTPDIISDEYSSSVEIKSSCFRNIRVSSSEGGLISGVDIGREVAIGCLFENVSAEEDGQKEEGRA